MVSNQNNIESHQDIDIRKEQHFHSQKLGNLNYLYPNGHRITHQMRWFKGSRDRGFNSDIAA